MHSKVHETAGSVAVAATKWLCRFNEEELNVPSAAQYIVYMADHYSDAWGPRYGRSGRSDSLKQVRDPTYAQLDNTYYPCLHAFTLDILSLHLFGVHEFKAHLKSTEQDW